jgi:hypothetical protein
MRSIDGRGTADCKEPSGRVVYAILYLSAVLQERAHEVNNQQSKM